MVNLFQNKTQTDVIAVLMLLGETTIWQAIWTRFRSRRLHWKQWVFAVSPGWAPLAATLFTAISNSDGSPNLIFNRPPESTIDDGLRLTNSNSGATHVASNTILQNVWSAWSKGPRQRSSLERHDDMFDITREVGVVELNLDTFSLENSITFWFQFLSLGIQITVSLILACLGWNLETFLVLCLAFLGQTLLLLSITPSYNAWYKPVRGHRGCAVILHRGLESTEVLFIRRVILHGREISLEEFAWDNHASTDRVDTLKVAIAATAFMTIASHIVFVGWMHTSSRVLYLLLGGLGLIANALQAACPPNWSKAYRQGFTGRAHCAPYKSCLLGAVGILLAAEFPSAYKAAYRLYPENERFKRTLADLSALLDETLCAACRNVIRSPLPEGQRHQCMTQATPPHRLDCSIILAAKVQTLSNKQLRDALATVYHFLSSLSPNGQIPPMDTVHAFRDNPLHTWSLQTETASNPTN